MILNNVVIPFTVADDRVRGRIVKFDSELNKILKQHQYPEPISRILAELLMVSSMIGSQFKEEVTLSVQFQSDHAVKYIVADYQSPNQIRGYAQFDDKLDYAVESYKKIINDGVLVVTIDRKLRNSQRYQGIVEINSNNISEAIEKYFYQSEQIKTSIKLAVGNFTFAGEKETFCAGGIMVQKLPSDDSDDDSDNDPWLDAQAYFNTIRDDELLDPTLSSESLLYSLYHEVGVKIYDYFPIVNQCRCSREKAEQVLSSLGEEEVTSLFVDDEIEINCQFCSKSQKFSPSDVKKLFTNPAIM